MNENSFVNSLKKKFPFPDGVGIGDDTSIVKKGKEYQLITKDILIEGVHFDTSYFSPKEIAIKALGVNLSDIAAMGGEAEYFFLGLGFPGSFQRRMDNFFQGIKEGCDRWGVSLAGGDISKSSDKIFISITMVGNSIKPIRRNGACIGDLIGITRVTGESSIGLTLLQSGIDIPYFTEKHKDPEPELEKGKIISRFASSMIDVSDGLLIDLGRIISASGKGGRVRYDAIPVTDRMKNVCQKYSFSEKDHVLSGGEDFALLFTVPPEDEKKLKATDLSYFIIGDITKGDKIRLTDFGKPISINREGFDHFS